MARTVTVAGALAFVTVSGSVFSYSLAQAPSGAGDCFQRRQVQISQFQFRVRQPFCAWRSKEAELDHVPSFPLYHGEVVVFALFVSDSQKGPSSERSMNPDQQS
jgi:hypothetical protein